MDRKKLIEYLPEFVRNFGEIQEIMRAENLETDEIDENIQRCLDNGFIEDCDEYGIKKYEQLLNINSSTEDTLESRKSKVLLRWNDTIPYTYRVLVRKLNMFCGVNNYDIISGLSEYYIRFRVHLEMFGQVEELEAMLDQILPANIFYDLDNDILCCAVSTAMFGGCVAESELISVVSD